MMEVKTNKTFSYTYTTNGGAWPTLAHSLRIIIGKEKIKKGEKKEEEGRLSRKEGAWSFYAMASLFTFSSLFHVPCISNQPLNAGETAGDTQW